MCVMYNYCKLILHRQSSYRRVYNTITVYWVLQINYLWAVILIMYVKDNLKSVLDILEIDIFLLSAKWLWCNVHLALYYAPVIYLMWIINVFLLLLYPSISYFDKCAWSLFKNDLNQILNSNIQMQIYIVWKN